MSSPKKLERCGISAEELHEAFDGESGRVSLITTHVGGCDPCSSALGVLEAHRDAVECLSRADRREHDRTAVELVLVASARAGRARLADLLYEMAKACLVSLPEPRLRVELLTQPREPRLVSIELQQLGSRIGDRAVHADDVASPTHRTGLETARQVLAILGNVEGETTRQQLASAHVSVFSGDPIAAETVLKRLLTTEVGAHRPMVMRNLTWLLNRMDRYQEAAELGELAVAEFPGDIPLKFNLAASLSRKSDRRRFEQVASSVAKLLKEAPADHSILVARHELAVMAEDLRTTVDEISGVFGLTAVEG